MLKYCLNFELTVLYNKERQYIINVGDSEVCLLECEMMSFLPTSLICYMLWMCYSILAP